MTKRGKDATCSDELEPKDQADPAQWSAPTTQFLYLLSQELNLVKGMHLAPEEYPDGDLRWLAGFELVRLMSQRGSRDPDRIRTFELAEGFLQFFSGVERALKLRSAGQPVSWEAIAGERHAADPLA